MTIHSVLIQKLLSTNAHLGRRVAANHFKIYTYGARNAMTIIDSDKTLICLRNACQFIGNLVRLKGRFLFVNTNSLCDEIVEEMTRRIGCANDKSWRLGGFLTNSGSPKKFRSRNKKLILSALQPPDCVVIMDTERKSSVILEADKMRIPIVGLVDSSMPWEIYKRITYPVPANDSVQFVYLFCNLITKTFLHEQKRFATATREEDGPPQQLSSGEVETGEELEKIKQRTDILVIPYGSLTHFHADSWEIKMLLDKLVVLKLNSGLGTKMGFDGPKSAIELCNRLTNLDLIVKQIESLKFQHGCDVPLILMNSVKTHYGILKVVEKYSKRNVDIHTFCQSQSHPVNEEKDTGDALYNFDEHELCELFLSLKKGGTLDALLSQGKEYILVMKSDNLAAVIDPKILNHLIQNRIQYCMEVMPNTSSDFEGSILSSHEERFQFSEIGQMPADHSKEKFRLYDTGNLWVNLKALKRFVEAGMLHAENHPVLKFFNNMVGVSVPQTHFKPLMETSDLLLVQSDLYTYVNGILTRSSARTNPSDPCIELGPEFQKLSDYQSRFKSIPSVVELDRLKVTGDVWFGTGITLKGKVTINAKQGMKIEIPDGVVLENKDISDPSDL
ncbi:UTP--glucose-1-phosphate uridylyltransferase [Bertholletia excelsa]